MVLPVSEFRVRPSFAKVLRSFMRRNDCEIRIDFDFPRVMQHCAHAPRQGQSGTWIGEDMQAAYAQLHHAGYAHSVETWRAGELVGGLYCVAIGRAVFGESMFTHQTNASKIALAALVALCRQHGVVSVDCQQNTPHLASMGAREVTRSEFVTVVERECCKASMTWEWKPLYWNALGIRQSHLT